MNIGKYVKMYSEDLRIKNYSENTVKNYCKQVELFLRHFEPVATKPSEISEKQIKAWLLEAKSINGRKHRISAVKLFYKLTGKQPLKFKYIEYPRSEKKLPQVIDKLRIIDVINGMRNLKHKAIITLAFSTGMRVSEVINLRIKDIDSSRMIITIRQSKGRKDIVDSFLDDVYPVVGLPGQRLPVIDTHFFIGPVTCYDGNLGVEFVRFTFIAEPGNNR